MNRLIHVITLNHRETFNVTHKHNDWQTARTWFTITLKVNYGLRISRLIPAIEAF